jgi:two-component system sensor histidine kinase/response regulator
MDIRMPVMDGLRGDPGDPRLRLTRMRKTVPIIALSADAYLADIQKAHDYGMTSHLSKPIDPALLLRTLQRDIQDRPDEP